MNISNLKEILALAIDLAIVFIFIFKKKKPANPVKFIAVTGVFAAIAIVLYVIVPDFGLGFTPPWLKVHLDEIPMFLVGFMYGPLSAVLVNVLKTIVKMPMSTTACVGEIGDFVFSLIFVLPAVIFYQKRRKLSSVFIGVGVSSLIHIVFAMFLNVYFLIPFYASFYGMPEFVLESMCSKVIPFVKGENWKWLYAAVMVGPMNLIKDAIVFGVVLLLYKRLHILINRIGSQPVLKKRND